MESSVASPRPPNIYVNTMKKERGIENQPFGDPGGVRKGFRGELGGDLGGVRKGGAFSASSGGLLLIKFISSCSVGLFEG